MQEIEKQVPKEEYSVEELPNFWWYRVYFAVIVTTVLVISALGIFSWYFSN